MHIKIPTYAEVPSEVPHLLMKKVRDVPVVSKFKQVWQRMKVKIKTRLLLKYMFEDRVLFGTSVIPDGATDSLTIVTQIMRAKSEVGQMKLDQKAKKWLFSPENRCLWIWSLLYALMILETTLVLPFRLAFYDSDEGSDWYYVDLFVDLLFFIDVLKTFNTAYYDQQGVLETSRLKIAIKYLQSWLIPDLISCVPMYEFHGEFLTTQEPQTNQTSSEFLRLLRVPRLYRLIKVSRFVKLIQELRNQECLERLQDKLFLKNRTLKLVVFLMFTMLLIHLVACFWFLAARAQGFAWDCWVTANGLRNVDIMDQYVASLYWTILTLATVGYGDIHPVSDLEMIFSCVWMLFSMLFVSFTVGSISSVLGIIHSKDNVKRTNLAIIDEFAREAGISNPMVRKLKAAVAYVAEQHNTGLRLKHSVFSELPRELKSEVSLAMHKGAAKSLSFFAEKDKAFIVAVVPYLRHMFAAQLTHIYKENDYADEIYFIVKGSCYIMVTDCNAIRRMQRGSYFGEIEVIKQIPRKFSAMTQLDTELLVMNKQLLEKIHRNFGEVYREMEKVAIVRDRLNEKARSELFKMMRMAKQRKDYSDSLVESSQSLASMPSSPKLRLRRGSVLMKVPYMTTRFDAAERFEKMTFRFMRINGTLGFLNEKLKHLMRVMSVEQGWETEESKGSVSGEDQ